MHCIVDFDLHVPGIAVTRVLGDRSPGSLCALFNGAVLVQAGSWVGCLLITAGAGALLWWMLPVAVRLGREGLVLNRVRETWGLTPALVADLERAEEAPENSKTAYELGRPGGV